MADTNGKLTNVITRASKYKVTWTPQGGSAIVLERGSVTLPGVDEATTYDYTTDIDTYTDVDSGSAFTNISLTTILSEDTSAGYSKWIEWAKAAKDGTLAFAPKEVSEGALSVTFNVTCNSVSEITMESGAIPTITVGFAVKSIVTG